MLGGPFRRCKRIWPIPVLITSLFIVIIWRRYQINNELIQKNEYNTKLNHIFRANQEEYVDRRGIRVIVGHYIGNSEHKIQNVSSDIINANNFAPESDAGRNGLPVVVEPKNIFKMQQLYRINRFNLLVSDKIPLNRSLPDVRKKKCRDLYKDYEAYPKSSVIIVFHNEAWSTLLRTVWSVINRSPKALLEEIILVDDASEREFLKVPLDNYIQKLPVPVQIIRNPTRTGLVVARLHGAHAAKGEVLTFLDAHCECTDGWLESLVARISENPTVIVCPIIDIINDDTFAYVKSFELHWGAFNWNLQFRWFTMSGPELRKRAKDNTQPFVTPTMAGGLFAVNKEYFFKLGAYDAGMKVWGGENLELSFRAWQCGGRIEIAPCSHVGHIFRKSSPYSFPGGITETLYSNLARVALVWMDEWGEFYFKFNDAARMMRSKQNVTERIQLRKNLYCKGFKWYLDYIWPQHFFPTQNRFFGRIRNVALNQCLMKPIGKESSNQPMGIAKLNDCLKEDSFVQLFVMTKDGFIMTDDSVCMDAPEKQNKGVLKVRIMACSGYSRQKWRYDKQTKEMIHTTNSLCLDLAASRKYEDGLVISKCTGISYQKWLLEPVDWH